tara:strand:+ start:617 stop:976 length:360 start_codon:yes stop_codon:yes gene_type:complete
MYKLSFSSLLFVALAPAAFADPAVIESVHVTQEGGLWSFDVTITHADTGWDHFSDAWRILDKDGNQLAIRELIHPHVDEQPLTRSLSGINLPDGITTVGVQTRDTQSGWHPNIKTVPLR